MLLAACPQLLYAAAAACAEAAAAGEGADGELPEEGGELVAFWVTLAGGLLKAAKFECIGEWIAAGVPSVSVSEVQWNVEEFARGRPRFRWRRWSVPSFLGAAIPASALPAAPGALIAAASEWSYDGADVGDVCRGGDLGCAGEGHCYALALDRTLASWFPWRPPEAPVPPVRLLELGACAGHSLAAWGQYLAARFGEHRLAAVDLDARTFRRHARALQERGFDTEQVQLIEADLSSLGAGGRLDEQLEAVGPFDIVVDDASHADAEIVRAFDALYFDEQMGLAPGGVYIVLDTQGSYRPGGTRLAHFKRLADDMQWSGTTVVSAEQLELFVAHTGSREEAWVEAVEFHRGLLVVRKRGAHVWRT